MGMATLLDLLTVVGGMIPIGLAVGFVLSRAEIASSRSIRVRLVLWILALGALYWFGAIVEEAHNAGFVATIFPTLSEAGTPGVFEVGLAGFMAGYVADIMLTSSRRRVISEPSGRESGPLSVEEAGQNNSLQAKGPSNPTPQREVGQVMPENATHGLSEPVQIGIMPAGRINGGVLSKDEKSILSLFLLDKVTNIVERADITKREGYVVEGLSEIKWETPRLRRTFRSLSDKGLLNAELSEKLPVCRSCESPNLQLRRTCPSCRSIKLTKSLLLEHYPCGLVARQDAFINGSDLVCPKCKAKLHMVGSDYRDLSYMFVCQGCGAINRDLLHTLKCAVCDVEVSVDDEGEMPLYSYSLNVEDRSTAVTQIRPVESCSAHYRHLGLEVIEPAHLIGRSGARHLFDLLISGIGEGTLNASGPIAGKTASRRLAVDILASNTAIEVEEIMGEYGKISDQDFDCMILVVPGLSADARRYAAAFRIRVIEGQTIDEALSKSDVFLTQVQGARG